MKNHPPHTAYHIFSEKLLLKVELAKKISKIFKNLQIRKDLQ